jgi:hypothetical protein
MEGIRKEPFLVTKPFRPEVNVENPDLLIPE